MNSASRLEYQVGDESTARDTDDFEFGMSLKCLVGGFGISEGACFACTSCCERLGELTGSIRTGSSIGTKHRLTKKSAIG